MDRQKYMKQYNATYYAKHKDKLIEKYSQKRLCDVCDVDVAIWHMSRHLKSLKHNNNNKKLIEA